MIGMTLGHYQITNQLGKGGMGEVHPLVGNGPVGAMHYTFSATVNRDVPGYSKGDRIALEIAAFLEVRQGRIVKIHELIVEKT